MPSGFLTLTSDKVRIRITARPDESEFEPFDVRRFEVGRVYEIGHRLAELLIVCGYAEPERRMRDRAADQPSKPDNRGDARRKDAVERRRATNSDQLRERRRQQEQQWEAETERRRHLQIREEHHDSKARTIRGRKNS